MTEATRREKVRAETERDIRRQARALLVAHGRDAVTLRAIARELGITAPALYRYYDSREDLLNHLCEDICRDLDAELSAALTELPDAPAPAQVFAVCREFRRWALAHPQEFALVFASTDTTVPCAAGGGRVDEQFGRVFLEVAAKLVASDPAPAPHAADVPAELHDDLRYYQQILIAAVADKGGRVDESVLHLGAIHHILQSWVRLYGHVALEVFGRFPFAVSNPEPMFDLMLTQMIGEMGVTA
ncbi:TetR/AcrR family transcriptional regulator [Saccharothrix coeruleofusca]|uniref:TetR family transcriptional regulator n=1 Tax=Saccharothrix coeruleofusca TaxID=33919 RepID=A0A918AHM0_9PSEU|nr:TetR/AcrR family transcriptional regulator [Saccharothrix coeruleofusca]MBP2339921.1 AcrR family transcriptional regulator [Saccharothrix coeruleofusca]GGP38620.1 TetR family transcriptional regulator [Saccharothrix coeruleofusca]